MSTEIEERIEINGYSIDTEGRIYRGDEQVATRDLGTGEVTLLPDKRNYRASVGRFINELDARAMGSIKLAPVGNENGGGGEDAGVVIPNSGPGGPGGGGYPPDYDETPPPSSLAPAEPPEPEPKAEEAPECTCEGKELSFAEVMRFYPEGAPACDWRGDLTPEFVDWFYENYPKEAELRYAGRFTHRNFEERQRAAREEARGGVI